MSDVTNLIDTIKMGDNVKAQDMFNGIMSDKLSAALDTKKIEVASSIFSTSEPVESEVEAEVELEQETSVDEPDV